MEKNVTERIAELLTELCIYNDRTKGAVAGEMYLGKDVFIATIRRPLIIEGEWEDVDRTVDISDLFDMHERGE